MNLDELLKPYLDSGWQLITVCHDLIQIVKGKEVLSFTKL